MLIGNYLADNQESMQRYAESLSNDLTTYGIKNLIWTPPVVFGKLVPQTKRGFGKYLAYIDKYLIATVSLLFLRIKNFNQKPIYHICDHSNAPYRFYLPRTRTGITCHDVLAIRGALGYEDSHCPATGLGVVLQKWILHHLKKIPRIAAVSQFTLLQLKELAQPKTGFRWEVVYNTFNGDFFPMGKEVSLYRLKNLKLPLEVPFILHVGSQLARKNRSMLIEMVAESKTFKGNIFFAGQSLDSQLVESITEAGLNDRVYEIYRPDHKDLVALYSSCFAFVFPSFSEGFGWPIIEAQACGAPVITSALDPMQEIGGNAVVVANPYKSSEFASALDSLQNEALRKQHIQAGYQNIKRFEKSLLVKRFLDLYKS